MKRTKCFNMVFMLLFLLSSVSVVGYAASTPVLGYPISDISVCSKATGYPNSNGKYHGGLDIPCKSGTSVYACESGKVVASEDLGNRTYGQYIKIRHLDGRYMIYAQLSDRAVEKGTTVKKGQYIGKSGKSGGVKFPHLHLEFRTSANKHDKTLNPKKYFSVPKISNYTFSKKSNGVLNLKINFKQTPYETPNKITIQVIDANSNKTVYSYGIVPDAKTKKALSKDITKNVKSGKKYKVKFRFYNNHGVVSSTYTTNILKR